MNKFAMFGKLVAHPGQRGALVDVLVEAAFTLGKMPECQYYIVSIVEDEPDAVWVTELWTDEEAHARALQNDAVRVLVQRGMPLIAEMPQQERLTPVGGKGLD